MFSNRYVNTILLSRVLLQLGIWIRNFAILLYVMDVTNNDPTYVSLISVAEFGPIFLFALIGGTFADRWRPKRTMVGCDLLSAASVVIVLAALASGVWQAILLGTFVSASLSQFSQPSAMKIFKTQVPPERLPGVMALFQSMVGIFTVAGPALGTVVYQQYGIETALALTTILFLGSGLVLTRLPRDAASPGRPSSAGSIRQELAAGLKYVRSRRELTTLVAVFAVSGLAAGLTQPLMAFVPIDNLGLDKTFLQWLLMANGIAMLLGGAILMSVAKKFPPQLLLTFGLTLGALCTAGTGFSVSVGLTLALQACAGFGAPFIHASVQTLLMRYAEAGFVGRVSGVVSPVFSGMMVVGMGIAGPLKTATTLPTAFAAGGALFLVGAALLLPLLRAGRRPGAAAQA
ncbi:MFS transporter [Paenibacillus sp.]|uniref:MFS transporter n=1 Tax=Paenibacillus sp. TaxID=58172 RepID=UPI00281142D0|nr:MFS transporter [Paenibacillus sp.]